MNPLLSRDRDMVNALHSPIEGTGVPMTVEWVSCCVCGRQEKSCVFRAYGAGGLSFDEAVETSLISISRRWLTTKTGRKPGKPRATIRPSFLRPNSHR